MHGNWTSLIGIEPVLVPATPRKPARKSGSVLPASKSAPIPGQPPTRQPTRQEDQPDQPPAKSPRQGDVDEYA